MKIQASGSSSFSKSAIRQLKQFSLELDMYLVLSNLRIFVFPEYEKLFWDINTKMPIIIKRESQCILKASNETNAFVTVGSCTFLVKKSDIKKIKK